MSEKFNFKYTAPTEEERREIDSIRKQYSLTEQTETKFEKLKRLDSLVKNRAIIWALSLGIIGCLIFGLGLTLVLEWQQPLMGIIIGAIGVIPMIIAYPVYKMVLNLGKKKYGEEILRLSEELLNESDK